MERSINLTEEDLGNIFKSIDILLLLRTIIRKTAPEHIIGKQDHSIIKKNLNLLNKAITPIYRKFGIKTSQESVPDSKITDVAGIENVLFLVFTGAERKKLISLGLEPTRVIATGGPLFANDMKEANPSLPDAALKKIHLKIDSTWSLITKKIRVLNNLKLILVIGESGIKFKTFFSRHTEAIQEKIGLPVISYPIESFQDINVTDLRNRVFSAFEN